MAEELNKKKKVIGRLEKLLNNENEDINAEDEEQNKEGQSSLHNSSVKQSLTATLAKITEEEYNANLSLSLSDL